MKDKKTSIRSDTRFTIESNGYIHAKDWKGKGQPELERVEATQWRVIVSDPNRFEACEIHEFKTKELAKEYITKQH